MSKESFRVYLAQHAQGLRSGTIIRKVDRLFEEPPPAAVGLTDEDVYAELERQLIEISAEYDEGEMEWDRFLWTESFVSRRVDVDVHPQNAVDDGVVIGKSTIPLRIAYAYCELENGGYRVVLPRFRWGFLLESLELAPEIIRNGIYSYLLGLSPGWIYDFRHEGEEAVVEWTPPFFAKVKRDEDAAPQEKRVEPPIVSAIAEEWVAKAERKRLPAVVGIDARFEALRPRLDADRLPSLLLVGGSGVGKSALVRRIARYFLDRRRGKFAAGKGKQTRLWATSADRVLAGMIYLGMWQERVLKLAAELSGQGDYFYIDKLADLVAPQSDGASIADLLAPFVISGEVPLIAECDELELEACRRRVPALVDAMYVVRLDEMPGAQLLSLLPLYQSRKNPNLDVHPDAWRRLVSHLAAFRRDLRFPGKALQFVDWWNQQASEGPASGAASASIVKSGTVFPRDMSLAFSRFSGLPIELISDDVPTGAADITAALARGVIGQDEACGTAARVLARFKAGINDPERPVGTLFFVGPTGVGKTELAKQMASYMFGSPDRLIRVDMSEYMTPDAAARLLQVGRGVTSLAERVRQQPLCVVLLDEIEKAHPQVFDLLLGILGEGRLTDTMGRLVDFRMAVIVMTSNLGSREVKTSGFAGAAPADGGGTFLKSVMQHFRPEFFNRIDHVLSFRALAPADIERIVDLELAKVRQRTGVRERNLTLRLQPGARARLAALGYDAKMGARPLRRTIEEQVVAPLAVRLAADPALRDRVISIVSADEAPGLSPANRGDAIVVG